MQTSPSFKEVIDKNDAKQQEKEEADKIYENIKK